MIRIAKLSIFLVVLMVVAEGCKRRQSYVRPRRGGGQQNTPPVYSPSPMGGVPGAPAGAPVAFAASGFLTDSDLGGFGLEPDARLPNQVGYDRYGAFHRYRIKGDIEVYVLPTSGASAAQAKSAEGKNGEQANINTGMSMNKIAEGQVQMDSVVGNSSWYAWAARTNGRCVVKVGFAKGAFYVKVLMDDSGGKEAAAALKPRVVAAAQYVANKLR